MTLLISVEEWSLATLSKSFSLEFNMARANIAPASLLVPANALVKHTRNVRIVANSFVAVASIKDLRCLLIH